MRNSTLYKLGGTLTFRRASTKILPEKNKKNVGWGNNLQNIEKSLREIYIADGFSPELEEKCLHWLRSNGTDLSIFTAEELDKLRVFAQTDQSGADAKIVAYECEARDYRKLFIHGVKPHVYVALKLFREVWPNKAREYGLDITEAIVSDLCDTPIELLKQHRSWFDLDKLIKASDNWSLSERYYYMAKQTCHSANYGIEWNTFIMNTLEKSGGKIVLTPEQGKFFLQTYRGLFPEIPERCRQVEHQVRTTGILYNVFGHPFIIWPGGNPPECVIRDMKSFYAWGPASAVAQITENAYSDMQEWIESSGKKVDLLADTHDSYMCQCPLQDLKEVAGKMKGFMEQKFISPVDGVPFQMGSETSVGFTWSPAKPDSNKNLCGLREFKV
jgi:hypothetical protein